MIQDNIVKLPKIYGIIAYIHIDVPRPPDKKAATTHSTTIIGINQKKK